MSTGLPKCKRLMDSLFCITCSLENHILCPALQKATLHYPMLHRFEIHSALVISRTCSLENNAFCVRLYVIKATLHYLMLHRFEIHSALQLWRTAILCCRRFAASRLREAARWQLMHSYRNLNEYYEVLKLTRSCAIFSMEKREKKRNEPWKRWIDRDTQCANSYRATIRVIFDCHAICNSSKFRSVQPVHTDGPH